MAFVYSIRNDSTSCTDPTYQLQLVLNDGQYSGNGLELRVPTDARSDKKLNHGAAAEHQLVGKESNVSFL